MKRFTALILIITMLLTACSQTTSISESVQTETSFAVDNQEIIESQTSSAVAEIAVDTVDEALESETSEINADMNEAAEINVEEADYVSRFNNLSDPELLQYVQDVIFSGLEASLEGDEYVVEGVNAIYYSNEYLEEIEYNSKANIFFGYTLEELDEQFGGTRYVFTLGDDGGTDVRPFEEYYDDTFNKVVKNVATGTGVILVCTTVSAISGALGAGSVCLVFAMSAAEAASLAYSCSVFGGVASGAIKGITTGEFDEAVKAAAVSASEGFKWGAIGGALVGGITGTVFVRRLQKAHEYIPSWQEHEYIPSWQETEIYLAEIYDTESQISFFDGQVVNYATENSVRPDGIRVLENGHLEAFEFKNYNLESPQNLNNLSKVLKEEISDRVVNLPLESSQRIVLDVRGRNYTLEFLTEVKETLITSLYDIYPNIPIDFVDYSGIVQLAA